MRETVELYGTPIREYKNLKLVYHGIDRVMYFNEFRARFCSPTSMTKQLEVKEMFYMYLFIYLSVLHLGIKFIQWREWYYFRDKTM